MGKYTVCQSTNGVGGKISAGQGCEAWLVRNGTSEQTLGMKRARVLANA